MTPSPTTLSDEALTAMIRDSRETVEKTRFSTKGVAKRLARFSQLYSALRTKPEGAALIYRAPGGQEVRCKAVGSGLLVGRTPKKLADSSASLLSVNDPEMSRCHLEIVRTRDGFFEVADMGSTNGLFINGRKTSRTILVAGMEILAGNTTLIFTGTS